MGYTGLLVAWETNRKYRYRFRLKKISLPAAFPRSAEAFTYQVAAVRDRAKCCKLFGLSAVAPLPPDAKLLHVYKGTAKRLLPVSLVPTHNATEPYALLHWTSLYL